MMLKKGFEFSFAWIFAIIVGGLFIFLAIYSIIRFIDITKIEEETEYAKRFDILLNPLGTNFESGKSYLASMPENIKLYNECLSTKQDSWQEIKIKGQTINGDASQKGESIRIENKYLFSKGVVSGKDYKFFIKPFKFPYKIGDLIFLFEKDETYCFVDAPREIKDELDSLQLDFYFVDDIKDCIGETRVCFGSVMLKGCDNLVSLSGKSVKKKYENPVYFEGNELLYAAIFSKPDLYECQLKRLMKRTSELASIYKDKSDFMSVRGCSSGMGADLSAFSNKTYDIKNTFDLKELSFFAEQIRRKNEILACKLF